MGCVWYDVFPQAGEKFSVELRNGLSEYERSILNSNINVDREILPTIGMLRREHHADLPIPIDIVQDFNLWRDAEYEAWMAKAKANPHRYGEIDPSDRIFQRKRHVGAVHFEPLGAFGDGIKWVVDVEAPPLSKRCDVKAAAA